MRTRSTRVHLAQRRASQLVSDPVGVRTKHTAVDYRRYPAAVAVAARPQLRTLPFKLGQRSRWHSERGSSSGGTPSREASPQERLDAHARNSSESRAPGLVVPHSGSALSGLAADADSLTFPQSLDIASFGSSEADSFPLSSQFGNLPMGYNDQLSMMNSPLNVDGSTSYSPWGSSSPYNGSAIDTSTANGQWSATSNQLLSNPDPIAPFFRNVQERNLVLVSPSSYY
ncbi:hypothetical protein FRC09_007419 [Ceratobasidium sp. 395]|nr:hypothetical protein FRC09_007419 [Ceratobasidium sp. 395]